ncbi:sn-glycerol-3-phosphate-binding periplasmic protein UgpB precursor [Variibacter gotjawalensis]|uniref:sn-glycerol-3-phosphate-binding periplasmic protein UgpB n=1 Tax=Variibacter gotjawalensis TaxID=1333996 RepID=A0A0S3PT15_9BRAD|nr:extracellular solute-binding protein [Variibacter gotjawalensis]NIK49420.1 multiple sugar transport system substrate-binding protein [Variibacter gotjawalensis]RZS51272.1 carbohydrate ABC transporter substrate-binding protein (CUT1 family) [Variibacter gotjawalensis]BAT59105.1 sn-glycerol-3-phosphate-binding periplasmic protein UgpB precursor [Variibacter gotjawalensis]
MRIDRRRFLASSAAVGGLIAAPRIVTAQSATTEISVQYSIPVLFKDLMENTARDFMAQNPNIKVTLRAPELGYEEIMQRNLRDAVTSQLPDVAFHGLNRQRTLDERRIPVDLKPFMDADAQTKELGFSPALLSLGQVGGKQTGIGFALSTPVLYYNADLVKAAGGNPDKLPETWGEVAKLAAAIHDPAKNQTGMFFDWTITGNWSWQGLVLSHGGTMLNADESKVAFTDEPGVRSIRVIRQFLDEGKMPDIKPDTMFQDMFAGRMGISMQSTAQLGRYNREIGGRFKLVCGRYPRSAPNARLPAGGNVAMMFAKDERKQKAAWEFIKFATGPVGATMMVNATGYMPATTVPAQRDDLLAKFYRDNPNHMVSIGQQDVITGWYAFPGQNALRITDVINDHLQTVVAKRGEPEETLTKMGAAVQAMLPKRAS